MPKPTGTIGTTKMKIMAVISHNLEHNHQSYGYNIWQSLKNNFYVYLKESDVRNVYHHLKDLCNLDLLERIETKHPETNITCTYQLTDKATHIKNRYIPYLNIIRQKTNNTK
jgi:DNA-binding PadR family transcriptional regulator